MFVFSKTGKGPDVIFHGLAAPGATGLAESDDLVAAWKTRGPERFQNYRAVFTILNVREIRRSWLNKVITAERALDEAPAPWRTRVDTGQYDSLRLDAQRPRNG